MSDLFGNHIVGFTTRWLIYITVDNYMEDIATDLLCKKNKMMDKFRILMLKESMVSCIAIVSIN